MLKLKAARKNIYRSGGEGVEGMEWNWVLGLLTSLFARGTALVSHVIRNFFQSAILFFATLGQLVEKDGPWREERRKGEIAPATIIKISRWTNSELKSGQKLLGLRLFEESR